MLLADTMAWVFAVVGLLLALPGLWLLCRGLWPNVVEKTTADCARGLIKPLLVGIPIAGLLVFVFSLITKLHEPLNGIFGIIEVSAFLLFSSTGIAGLATVIGQRLPSPADAERPWNATIRGGVVLELAFLVPIVGWFFLLPLSLILGSGAALRAIIKTVRSRAKPAKPTPAPGETSPITAVSPPAMPFDNGTLGAPT
jgi:hypothetical protein